AAAALVLAVAVAVTAPLTAYQCRVAAGARRRFDPLAAMGVALVPAALLVWPLVAFGGFGASAAAACAAISGPLAAYAALRLRLALPALAIEGLGARAAIARSAALMRGRYGQAILVWAGLLALSALVWLLAS